MAGSDEQQRLDVEVVTSGALGVAPQPGRGGTHIWWVVGAVVVLAAAVAVALRVGESAAPAPSTTTPNATTTPISTTTPNATTTQAVPTSTPDDDLAGGDVVVTDVVVPRLPYDVAVLDDASRLWVLHPADGTATYRGQIDMAKISSVGAAAPPPQPSLSVSRGGWLLVGGTFGTFTVNLEGQHILTVHDVAEPVRWDGTDSRTYTYWPDTGTAHVEYDGGSGWLPTLRVGPMDRRVIVDTEEGSFVIEDDEVALLTPNQVLDANHRYVATRDTGGEVTIAELGTDTLVGAVYPSFLTDADAAALMADPELQVSLASDGRTVSLLDGRHVYIVDVASGEGGLVALAQLRFPYRPSAVAWDPAGEIVTWVVDGQIRVLDRGSTSALIGPTIGVDGSVPIGNPVAAVAYPADATG